MLSSKHIFLVNYFFKKEKRGTIDRRGEVPLLVSLAIITPKTILFFFLLPHCLFFYCCGEGHCSFSSDSENPGGAPLTAPPLNTPLSGRKFVASIGCQKMGQRTTGLIKKDRQVYLRSVSSASSSIFGAM